ncbi:hypothetical protein [Sporosarcina limicola]|uniref:Uncharacterized protein n=1 Tax=Sporosarcina limicola TaxID=34101 RepID=A0A927R3W8_9BACL|nr:hypothetical protein [Sporosarcina limicola]MBE1554208.1 hypothetical protein [Sporosarcina limicola]
MGLFINNYFHPDVFKNEAKIDEPNQGNFKADLLSEWMDEQKQAYESITKNFIALEKSMKQQKNNQTNQWRTVRNRFDELMENSTRQLKFENVVLESLTKLDDKNKTLQRMVKTKRLLDREFIEQINKINHSNTEIVNRLDKSDTTNENLSLKMNQQMDQQMLLSDQISKQEIIQSEVVERLDAQEGLMEKLVKQMNHFRSILFERTTSLGEKIDHIYSFSSSNRTKPEMDSERSFALYKTNETQKEKQGTN